MEKAFMLSGTVECVFFLGIAIGIAIGFVPAILVALTIRREWSRPVPLVSQKKRIIVPPSPETDELAELARISYVRHSLDRRERQLQLRMARRNPFAAKASPRRDRPN